MKKKLFIILGVFVVNISLVLFFTLKKEDNNVISKEETFKTSELPNEIMAYTLNGEKTSLSYNALINNNTVNKITCKNGTIATFNSSDKSISFSNIKMPDYCTIDFNQTFYSKLLVDNPKVETRTDFSTPFTSNIANTLYKATENGEDVYYFAGSDKTNKINNWVYFGGYYWRIIRTNYDSSIRLLYVGTSKDTTTGYIGKSSYSNSSRDPMNVGYMYGTTGSLDNNRTNENNSLIKEYIDNWYDGTRTIVNSTYQKEYTDESTNKLIDYSKYISTEAIYCNDRSTPIYNMSSYFQYGAGTRVHSNKKPSYDCGKNTSTNAWIGGSQSVDDMFTYTSSNVGNKKLKYPIGLMTSDEIIYAGGIFTSTPIDGLWYTQNSAGNNVNSSNWWTLSPRYFSGDTAFPYEVETGGNLIGEGGAGSILGVRPVISLKGNLIWKSGDGSSASPYEVEELPSTLLANDIKEKSITNEDGVYNENGYRYEGTNPNNYIYMTNKSTNEKELWRIIGVFNDGENGEEVIRVRRHYEQNSYPEMAYDTGSSTAYNYKNISETNGNLLAYNDILNKNYIALPEPGGCSSCTNHFPTTMYNTLSSTYNLTNYDHTINFKIYLGTSNSSNLLTVLELYLMERGTTPGYTAAESYNSAVSFIGSVGIMYPSDYGYGVLASECARTIKLYNYSETAACYNNNWLFQGSNRFQWAITPFIDNASYAYIVTTDGYVSGGYVGYNVLDAGAYSPVMALSSDVLVNGSGTKDDPYVITN